MRRAELAAHAVKQRLATGANTVPLAVDDHRFIKAKNIIAKTARASNPAFRFASISACDLQSLKSNGSQLISSPPKSSKA